MSAGLELQVDIGITLGSGGPDRFVLSARFVAEPETTVAIVGPNGSGKSTLIHALVGTVPIDRGSVRLGDGVWADATVGSSLAPEERPIAYVPQDALLFPHLSVADNVAFGLRYRLAARRAVGSSSGADQRVTDALERVGLAALAERRPEDLSGGQQQRVAVARALVLEPSVLLLDEPLSNVDSDNRREIRDSIQELRPEGQIQIVVTHGAEHARAADRVIALEGGRVVGDGTPSELARSADSRSLRELLGPAD